MRTILIVEDEKPLRENIQNFLVAKHFTVYTASSSREATDICATKTIHLVILDIYLGNELGLDIAIKISSDKGLYSAPKIIVMSGTLGGELLRSDHFKRDNHFDEFIKKPFELEELLSRINTLLDLT